MQERAHREGGEPMRRKEQREGLESLNSFRRGATSDSLITDTPAAGYLVAKQMAQGPPTPLCVERLYDIRPPPCGRSGGEEER